MASTMNSIGGLWIDENDDCLSGQQISRYIQSHCGKEVIRVTYKNESHPKDEIMHSHYLALLSKKSCKDHQFMVFLTSVLYQLHYLEFTSKVVLVVIDETFEEKYLPINLRSFDKVTCLPSCQDSDLHELVIKLTETSPGIVNTLPVGNIGIGLAWSYFYGYLALILPGIKDRILKSEIYKEHGNRMGTQLVITIPDSCHTPASFKDADERFSTVGPLDGGIEKSRAGQPNRHYKNFLHRIKGNNSEGEDYYFCGEFATPVLALQKMLNDPSCKMDEQEMEKQLVLFRHALMSIINHERNLDCKDQAFILNYADNTPGISLADKLVDVIASQSECSEQAMDTCDPDMGTFVYIQSMTIVSANPEASQLAEERQLAEEIESFCASANAEPVLDDKDGVKCYSVRTLYSLEDLDPKLAKANIVDKDPSLGGTTPSDKLIVILCKHSKEDVEKYADDLINHPIWFPRTTILIDLPEKESLPDWLENSGVDYIDTCKHHKTLWKRIFGSLFGTSSVEGEADERWRKQSEGIQYQTDRLPIGNVAEGLAWSYYHNYLTLIGPRMAERIKQTEYFAKKTMPSKLFILLPYTCFSHPKLENADNAITSAGKLETLTIQIAGNNRNYDTAIHAIQAKGETYYACVEYCTPVLVMYEMEAEGKAGLSPMQKAAQLHIFHKVLQRIMDLGPSYCKDIKLIAYDDEGSKPLSEILVEQLQNP